MTTPTDAEYIINHFKFLSHKEKRDFLLLTKHLIEYRIIVLDDENQRYFDLTPAEIDEILFFQFYPFIRETVSADQDAKMIYHIYQTYSLFLEVIDYIYKTDYIESIDPLIISCFGGEGKAPKIKKFFQIIVLINLTRNVIGDGLTNEEVDFSELFGRMREIKENLIDLLNLTHFKKLDGNVKKPSTDCLNYQNINIDVLMASLKNDKYDELYRLFQQFL